MIMHSCYVLIVHMVEDNKLRVAEHRGGEDLVPGSEEWTQIHRGSCPARLRPGVVRAVSFQRCVCVLGPDRTGSFRRVPLQHLINEGWARDHFLAVPRWWWEIRLLALGRTIWRHRATKWASGTGTGSILGNGVLFILGGGLEHVHPPLSSFPFVCRLHHLILTWQEPTPTHIAQANKRKPRLCVFFPLFGCF